MLRDDPTLSGARAVTAVAPAKINLHLAVGRARADGFHELVTVYRAVDLWEEVTVAVSDDDELTVSGPDATQVPTDRSNLAARAVDLLREEAGARERLAVHIHKGVPVAGGMAGGSADAAAALVATDRLLGLGLGRAELEERAARLGSDIPFCVRGGTALGTGRGEELATLLHARAEQHIVVATIAGGLSTPAVYAELDRLREQRAAEGRDLPRVGSADPLIRALAGDDPRAVAPRLGNDLQAAALSLLPALRRTLRAGEEAGALRAMVSGSGPTCLFFCADHDSALAVATEVSELGVARELRITRGPVSGAHIPDTPTRK
ncbi:MAG TPA: 4-(cytidine 5'-diphospho)-2-C-methyl-D-erythritol kinase [Candidatus Dietzia intestinipullorum]|nr:4-(cytidine 5'-diphospho)-2-C-methyl-D-erythritol kinase [Candidatus Dietzia intestinipullorum]